MMSGKEADCRNLCPGDESGRDGNQRRKSQFKDPQNDKGYRKSSMGREWGADKPVGSLPIQTADQRPAGSVPLSAHHSRPTPCSTPCLPLSWSSPSIPPLTSFLSPSLLPTLFQGPSSLLPPLSTQHSWLTLCLSSLGKPLPISLLLFMSCCCCC